MQDQFPIPSCFGPGEPLADDPAAMAAAARSGQSIVVSVYRTKVGGHCQLINVTWCRNVLTHGLLVSIDGAESSNGTSNQFRCKVEMRPWHFWRKHGSKRFEVEGKLVDVFWDLRSAKFSGEPEPQSNYYVAVVSDNEVVLLVGDYKKEAYGRTGCRPAAIDAALVSRKEHIFGKKRFATRTKFHERGRRHEISIECGGSGGGSSAIGGNIDPEMVVKIDGVEAIHVRHLQWKFRGNQSITVSRTKVEMYWDVHDWLFSPGPRHAFFIFKPQPLRSSPSLPLSALLSPIEGVVTNASGPSEFCLFLYAWKLE